MSQFNYLKKMLCTGLLLSITACGGSGTSADTPTASVVKTGYFIDSAVAGLEYVSGNTRGITSSDGAFQYEEGKPVSFYIGNMRLGSLTVTNQRVFPLDLVTGAADESDPKVLLMAQILQTLDSDGDPSNGITITDTARKAITHAIEVATADPTQTVQTITQLLASATANRASVLISETDAKNHMKANLLKEYVGTWTGTYTGTEKGTCDFSINLSEDESSASISGYCLPSISQPVIDPPTLDQNSEPISQGAINNIFTDEFPSSGNFSGTLSDSAEFKGRFNRNGTMTGSWTRASYGGTWSLTKQAQAQ
jgi:hypothetical protein